MIQSESKHTITNILEEMMRSLEVTRAKVKTLSEIGGTEYELGYMNGKFDMINEIREIIQGEINRLEGMKE